MFCFVLFTTFLVGMKPKDDYVKLVVVSFKLGQYIFFVQMWFANYHR
jgi:hypothetical protein